MYEIKAADHGLNPEIEKRLQNKYPVCIQTSKIIDWIKMRKPCYSALSAVTQWFIGQTKAKRLI